MTVVAFVDPSCLLTAIERQGCKTLTSLILSPPSQILTHLVNTKGGFNACVVNAPFAVAPDGMGDEERLVGTGVAALEFDLDPALLTLRLLFTPIFC